ncbi:MAG: hypothetical protein U9N02_03825 [Campylobacterota bacterium]|nr:hypothetical protein [Campylobacterota bacterium]
MLDNSVWKQYNKENDFREKLAEFCVLDADDLIQNDKELYGVMKSKLTKKELKLFAMDSASICDADIQTEFDIDSETLEKMKFKLYKKFKQDKTRLSFRLSTEKGE